MKSFFQLSVVSNLLWILIFASCSNEPAVSPNYIAGWQPPVVTGMELTDETDVNRGNFGNPDFPENIEPLEIRTVYPNPAGGLQSIEFSISEAANVKVWVTPAQWVNESITNWQVSFGGNLIDAGGGKAIEVLIDGSQEFFPGIYRLRWDPNNSTSEVPPGFYRIYVQANGVTLWRDVYQCDRFQKAPYGLDKYSEECR